MTPARANRPPRLARWIMHVATPKRERVFLLGDLHEEFERMLQAGAPVAYARRWYWEQVIRSVVPAARRMRSPKHRPTPRKDHGMHSIIQDLRFGARTLRRNPIFAAVSIATLAVGIGANVAIFSVVNGVLLKPLPYEDPDRVVRLFESRTTRSRLSNTSYPDLVDVREQSETLEAVVASNSWNPSVILDGRPMRFGGESVSANLFDMLGVRPVAGRFFSPAEQELGHEPVVVLGFAAWREYFGASESVLGTTLSLNDIPYTVIGVAPPGLELPRGDMEIWRARPTFFDVNVLRRGGHNMQPLARMRPGVTLEEVQAELDVIMANLEAEYPASNTGHRMTAVPVKELMVGSVRPALLVLLSAVGLVLLIACANVANLLLSRAVGREREIAVRTALGAGRSRLLGQLLAESVLLSLVGGLLGVGIAWLATRSLIALGASGVPRANEVGLDVWVLAFAAVTSLGTALLFGVFPAVQSSKPNLNDALKEGRRGTTSGSGTRLLRNSLVVSEIALSLILLIGAGLLIRSFQNMRSLDPGFRSESVLTFRLAPTEAVYSDHSGLTRYYESIVSRIEALPGVRSAGAISFLPMGGGYEGDGVVRDDRPPAEPGEGMSAEARAVTPSYFATMGMTLIRGRGITAADDSAANNVAVINEEFARQLYPGEEPIGKRFTMVSTSHEIVGIVADVMQFGVQETIRPATYGPHAQTFVPWIRDAMDVVVRSETEPEPLANAVRAAVWEVNGTVPITNMRTMESWVSEDVAGPRFRAVLLTVFAGVAMFLAAIGIAGVMAFTVSQRTGEIGVRMALGAKQGDILRLVVSHGAKLTVLGIGLGLAAAFVATKALSSMLFGIQEADALTFVTVPIILGSVAMLATLVPAWRASRLDPSTALREE